MIINKPSFPHIWKVH